MLNNIHSKRKILYDITNSVHEKSLRKDIDSKPKTIPTKKEKLNIKITQKGEKTAKTGLKRKFSAQKPNKTDENDNIENDEDSFCSDVENVYKIDSENEPLSKEDEEIANLCSKLFFIEDTLKIDTEKNGLESNQSLEGFSPSKPQESDLENVISSSEEDSVFIESEVKRIVSKWNEELTEDFGDFEE